MTPSATSPASRDVCSLSGRARQVIVCAGILWGSAPYVSADDLPTEFEFFERRIRPVLIERCYECHSAGVQSVGRQLLLDSRGGLLRGGDSGPAIVPGSPADSLLMDAIRYAGPEMPPDEKLPADVIADFEQWIMQGAADPRRELPTAARTTRPPATSHWAFQPVGDFTAPAVTFSDRPQNEIDRFILAELQRRQLIPAPPADRRTLIRRVTFALTGLPPTPGDVRRFLDDPSPQAYHQVVDRLLASPQFGERWARHWMDLVRYAETRGHEADYVIPNAWQYRDYLIRAFNDDLPYDQFVIEHLAGDLLQPPRLRHGTDHNESILATGWAFLGDEIHAPVDIRQDELERVDNKIDVFGKTFLGLTISCARCHDHKFDPITQEDYYALSGFVLSSCYRQVRFESMQHNARIAAQLGTLREDSADQLAQLVSAAQQPGLRTLPDYLVAAGRLQSKDEQQIASAAKRRSLDVRLLTQWVRMLRKARQDDTDLFYPWTAVSASDRDDSDDGFRERLDAITLRWENSDRTENTADRHTQVIVDYANSPRQSWMVDGFAFGSRPVRVGDPGYGNTIDHPITRVFAYAAARRDPFWNGLSTEKYNQREGGLHGATLRSGRMLRTPTFRLDSGRVHCLIRGTARIYAGVDSHIMLRPPRHEQLMIEIKSAKSRELRWVTLDLTQYAGHRVHLEFGPSKSRELEILRVVESPHTPPPWRRLNPQVLRLLRNDAINDPDQLAVAYQQLLLTASQRLSQGHWTESDQDRDLAELADWLVRHHDLIVPAASPQQRQLSSAVASFIREQQKLADGVRWKSRTAVSWWDGNGVDEHVLVRGNYRSPASVVSRRLPQLLPNSVPVRSSGSGRLEMATQLVQPSNPLLARVMVNRAWHHLFGRGIVESVDNFGLQGRPPTHPELLDYLTQQFVQADHWSLKELLRRIVLSATYQMSSEATDRDAQQIDPANQLLHRMPLLRLEGEAVRDSILAVSGSLNPAMFGRSVPMYFTDDIASSRSAPERRGAPDGLGRRSVYIEVRRNIPSVMLSAFDAPIPFSTVGRRGRTNVPTQALVLMNDRFIYQQANVWAQQLLGGQPACVLEDTLQQMYEVALNRPPSADEKAAFLETAAELAELHGRSQVDETVLTELCHVFFNLTEFIYIR